MSEAKKAASENAKKIMKGIRKMPRSLLVRKTIKMYRSVASLMLNIQPKNFNTMNFTKYMRASPTAE
jgi:hypothetical protein